MAIFIMRFRLSTEQTKQIVSFLFKSLFVFWLLLSVLDLFMPGFAIRYVNLNYLLLATGTFFLLGLFL